MQLSPQQLDGILSSMGEGLLVVDTKGKVILVNQTAGILLKIAPADAMGKNIATIFRLFKSQEEPTPPRGLIEKAIKQLTIIRIRLADGFYCKDMEERVFSIGMVITPLFEEQIAGAVIIFRDLTEEKEIDRAKSEFVSLASHQLRTPLSTVNWYTEMLLDEETGPLNEEQRAYAEEIYRANQRMVGLVNAFLSVSRIELGTLPNNPEPTSVPDVASAALSELKPLIQEKELVITTAYGKNLPKIIVDPGLLLVVFQNLLSNAAQYTPKKGKIEVAITNEASDLLIKIRDTGYGIAKKDYPKIFTKLFRGDNVRERETSGNGLGMYIVKAIIDASGGKIKFESDLNVGTTFYITFPLSPDTASLPRKTSAV